MTMVVTTATMVVTAATTTAMVVTTATTIATARPRQEPLCDSLSLSDCVALLL